MEEQSSLMKFDKLSFPFLSLSENTDIPQTVRDHFEAPSFESKSFTSKYDDPDLKDEDFFSFHATACPPGI